MKNFNAQQEVKKQVEMYFDQALDPHAQQEFLQKVNSDPEWQQAFDHEKNMRDQIKKHIRRPDNSSQLMKAIKNQIQHPKG